MQIVSERSIIGTRKLVVMKKKLFIFLPARLHLTLLMAGALTCNCLLSTISFAQVIAAGGDHSLARCTDGTLRSWGDDFYGQLGDNAALTDQPTPVAVATLTGIVAIATGSYHSLALKSDGTVWSWGNDGFGQLGDDATFVDKPTPVQVNGLTGIIAIAAGAFHSFALKNDSTVWSWGYDAQGQLGDDAILANMPTPVPVDAALTGIIAIAAGGNHSLALKSDGTVWSWGSDANGQLGDDAALINKPTPVQAATLTGITAISGGGQHSLALKNDGMVWSWGFDASGQLGNDAALVNQPTPVQVSALTGITAIAGGGNHSLALKNGGTVWTWGLDLYGQLGDGGTNFNQPTPVAVATVTGIAAIAGGGNHSLALKNDGTVWSWGKDAEGQLGDNAALVQKPTPVQASPLCNVTLPGAAVAEIYEQDAIRFYPNPSSGLFQVQNSKFKVQHLEVCNVLGEKVYSTIINSQSSTLNLNVPDGLYFIKIISEGNVRTGKLIIQ